MPEESVIVVFVEGGTCDDCCFYCRACDRCCDCGDEAPFLVLPKCHETVAGHQVGSYKLEVGGKDA